MLRRMEDSWWSGTEKPPRVRGNDRRELLREEAVSGGSRGVRSTGEKEEERKVSMSKSLTHYSSCYT